MLRKAILVAGEAGLVDLLGDSFLAREGFTLLPAAPGSDIFGLLEEEDPALAILDLDRPDLVESCRRIRDDRLLRNTPRVLIASAPPEQRPANVEELVPKPVDRHRLLAAACRLLRIDRRADPRRAMRFPVRIGRRRDKLDPGQVRNLSPGGAFVETDRLFPVGTTVILEMNPAGWPAPVHYPGRVAWVNHPEWIKKPALPIGLGVEFLALGESELTALEALLSRVSNRG